MSKSAFLSSSIAKKWWMALTGLFLCLFLVAHLFGNLQLILATGVEGKRAFNEYSHFMATNPLIKTMSYVTYLSILFHAVDGIWLTIQNRRARPERYVYEKPNTNSKWYSRSMAILGSLLLVFIVLHMQHFWWKAKHSAQPMPAHKEFIYKPELNPMGNGIQDKLAPYYYTTKGDFLPADEVIVDSKGNKKIEFYADYKKYDPNYQQTGKTAKLGEGYKDLHSVVMAFFGHDKSEEAGITANQYAVWMVIIYVFAMAVLGYHLLHGFASAFQSLGLNNKRYDTSIKTIGTIFAVGISALFAIIPVIIYLTR